MTHKTIVFITLLLAIFSTVVYGNDFEPRPAQQSDSGIYYSFESSAGDHYSGIGFATTFKSEESHFGINLATSLSEASVMTDLGFNEHFLAWEGHVKIGYFSKFSVYGEFGFDIGELLSPDFRQIDDIIFDALVEDEDRESHGRDIDTYVGIGAGINLGKLNISAFSRVRDINSEYWQAENDVFTGVQFSISF